MCACVVSHVLIERLPTSLVLQTSLGQVDGEHTSDSYYACYPPVDQFGWEAANTHTHTHTHISNTKTFPLSEQKHSLTLLSTMAKTQTTKKSTD